MTHAPIARGSHSVRFFENETNACRTIAEFFSDDARVDDSCIMVARAETFARVRQALSAHAATIALADRIRFFAAPEGLARFLIGDALNRDRVEEYCLHILSYVPTGSENAKVRLYGEIPDLLCERNQHALALQLEDFAGLLFALESRLSILCGYNICHFVNETHAAVLRSVCGKHTDVGAAPGVADAIAASGEPAMLPGVAAIANSPSCAVFIVDDDASMRRSLGRLLSVSNFRVCVFDSAEAFLKEAAAFSEGCLLLDIQLRGMTGLELIVQLAEQDFRLPIIAMSGFVDEKTESEALRLGVREFLHKPFEPKALLDAIARAQR